MNIEKRDSHLLEHIDIGLVKIGTMSFGQTNHHLKLARIYNKLECGAHWTMAHVLMKDGAPL